MDSLAHLELASVEKPECGNGRWTLSFKLPDELCDDSPSVDISTSCVRVEGASGQVGVAEIPSYCGAIAQDEATCKLSRKKGQLTISWPSSSSTPSSATSPPPSLPQALPKQEVEEKSSSTKGVGVLAVDKGAERVSLDYSRFNRIGEDVQDMQGPGPVPDPVASSPMPPSPPAAVAPPPKRSAAVDYSRFEDICEDDATVPMAELEKLWKQESQLQRMRGEGPEGFAEWQRRRAKTVSGAESKSGRGLWSRTNMEESFAAEACRAADENPCDAELPALPVPDMLTAMTKAPGVEVVDIAKWAQGALREELVKACATDRNISGKDADVRADAIAYAVDVGSGNCGIVVDGTNFLCAYRFALKISYCVATSERPSEGNIPHESKYMGDIEISELSSGIAAPGTTYLEALTKKMKTSLRDPKPPKHHLAAMRPVLGRLELSLAHFIRRFERRLLNYPASAMKKVP